MRKHGILFLLLCLCLLLWGCANGTQQNAKSVVQGEQHTAAVSPQLSASASMPLQTNDSKPTPKNTALAKTEIPAAVQNGEGVYYASDDMVFEDESNIYCIREAQGQTESRNELLSISKKDKTRKVICKDCYIFTYYKEKIYYVPFEYKSETEKNINRIRIYDIKTGSDRSLRKFRNEIYSLAVFRDRLYIAWDTRKNREEGYEPYSDLYSMRLDGRNLKLIVTDVYIFLHYRNKIYYLPSSSVDAAPLYMYDTKTGSSTHFHHTTSGRWRIIISNDLLFIDDDVYDLRTGKQKTVLPDANFALYGQYAVYTERTQKTGATIGDAGDDAQNEAVILKARDIITGRDYDLAELPDDIYDVNTTAFGVILSQGDIDSPDKLFRFEISEGKASLELIADFTVH